MAKASSTLSPEMLLTLGVSMQMVDNDAFLQDVNKQNAQLQKATQGISMVANTALATIGDTITLDFETDEQLSAATITIDGVAVAFTPRTTNNPGERSFGGTATYTIPPTKSTTGEVCDFNISNDFL